MRKNQISIGLLRFDDVFVAIGESKQVSRQYNDVGPPDFGDFQEPPVHIMTAVEICCSEYLHYAIVRYRPR